MTKLAERPVIEVLDDEISARLKLDPHFFEDVADGYAAKKYLAVSMGKQRPKNVASLNDDAIKQELGKLGEGISAYDHIIGTRPALPLTPNEKLKLWVQTFQTRSPHDIYHVLSQNFADTQIQLYEPLPDYIGLCWWNSDKDKARIMIDFPAKAPDTAKLSAFNVTGTRSQGIGTKAISNVVDFIEAYYPDVKKIALNTENIGSYCWAKFGFAPEPASWRKTIRVMKMRREMVRDQIPQKINDALDVFFAQDKDPKVIGAIADMDYCTVTLPKESPVGVRHLIEENKTTLGKFLLIDNRWRGQLDLTDKKSTSRLKGYIAKLSMPEVSIYTHKNHGKT